MLIICWSSCLVLVTDVTDTDPHDSHLLFCEACAITCNTDFIKNCCKITVTYIQSGNRTRLWTGTRGNNIWVTYHKRLEQAQTQCCELSIIKYLQTQKNIWETPILFLSNHQHQFITEDCHSTNQVLRKKTDIVYETSRYEKF